MTEVEEQLSGSSDFVAFAWIYKNSNDLEDW